MNDRRVATILKILLALLVVAVLTVSAFGLGFSVGTHYPAAAAGQPTATAAGQAGGSPLDNALVREAWSLLQKQYYGDLPQGKDVTYAALNGILARLGDPHTTFLDPQNARLFNSYIEGSFEGIGALVAPAPGGGVLITYVFPGQPAETAGVRVNDVITAVDGQDITRLALADAVSRIRGPKGSNVVLTIDRAGEPAHEITATRARIEIPVVTTKTLGDGRIAYISLREFSSVATGRLADALTAALDQKPAGLILDLRGNPGGLLDAAVSIGSFFVPEGNILLERHKDGSETPYPRTGRYLLGRTPLVVLIDNGSASAAEIVAGAVQDAGTGVLMGEHSYGKGSVQLPNNLSDGSQLRVTIAHWFTPKGRAIDNVGLTPDYIVRRSQADADAGIDPQVDAAVRYLLGERAGLQTPTPGTTRTPARPAATGTPTAQP